MEAQYSGLQHGPQPPGAVLQAGQLVFTSECIWLQVAPWVSSVLPDGRKYEGNKEAGCPSEQPQPLLVSIHARVVTPGQLQGPEGDPPAGVSHTETLW